MQNLIKRNTGPHRHAPGAGQTLAEKLAQTEAMLAASDLNWLILRPSLVVGRGAFGGTGLVRALAAMPGQWLDAGTTVRAPTLLVLGPEPLIGPQQVLITHQAYPERTLRIATDGVRPFTVETVQ